MKRDKRQKNIYEVAAVYDGISGGDDRGDLCH